MNFTAFFNATVCLLFVGAIIPKYKKEEAAKWIGVYFLLKALNHFLSIKYNGSLLIPVSDLTGALISFALGLLRHVPIYFFFNTYINRRPPPLLITLWLITLLCTLLLLVLPENYQLVKILSLCITGIIIINFTWLLLAIRKYIKTSDAIQLSQYQRLGLYWGKWFIITHLLLVIGTIFLSLLSVYISGRFSPIIAAVINSCDFVVTFSFGYLLVRDAQAFNNETTEATIEQKLFEMVLPADEKTTSKSKIVLSDLQVNSYKEKLLQKVEVEKVYLNENLNLRELAKLTGIPLHHLSYLINTEFKSTFNDYINTFRVAYAKQLLSDPKKSDYTIYSVAIESGFGSERTFYRIFKQHTGQTANKYRASL